MKALAHRMFTTLILAAVLLGAATPGAWARSEADSLVTGFDLDRCVRTHVPGFEVTRIGPVWGVGLEALAVERASREIVHLAVGVFGSSQEAADAAAARVADFSIRLDRGSLSGKSLGDGAWSAGLTVIFHRDNVLVQVFGSSRERVQALAEIVDRELAGKEDGDVTRGSRVSRPTISGMRSPAGNVPVGSDVEVRLNASTRMGRQLYYSYHPEGGELLGGDPPIPLVYRGNTVGAHVLRFAAMDAHCVISSTLELPIEVVEARP